VARRAGSFPWGTFVVNVSGSFLLGLVFTLLSERVALAPWVRASVSIGFLGAYTTFSTLSLESYRLIEARSYGLAGANLLGSVVAGMLALYGGVVLGRAI
jgi:CrcB protein